MRFSEAFRETMFRFSLVGAELAEQTGLTPNQISDFRNGKVNPRIDTVERILGVLPKDAREYMLLLVLEERESDHVPLPKTQTETS